MPKTPYGTPITYEALLRTLNGEGLFGMRHPQKPSTETRWPDEPPLAEQGPKFLRLEEIYKEANVAGKRERAALKHALYRAMDSARIEFRKDKSNPAKPRLLFERYEALKIARNYSK